MVTPPSENELAETARTAPEIRTLLGDEDGNAPDPTDEQDTGLRLLSITRTAGGSQLDEASFAYDLGALNETLTDIQTPTAWARQVEIWLYPDSPDDEEEEAAGTPLFWGDLTEQSISIDRGEQAIIRAQVRPYHFGGPLTVYHAWDPVAEQTVDVFRDPVFNPRIDDETIGNESALQREPDDATVPLFLDPESTRTAEAMAVQGVTARLDWTLERAIRTVAFLCNEDEEFVDNIDPDDDEDSSVYDDVPALLNLRLDRGQYLPAYLDAMLTPHGLSWYLRITDDGEGGTTRQITVFRRGVGPEKEIYLQRPGEDLDIAKSNTLRLAQSISVGELVNRVVGHGSLDEYEVTIELYRGWPEADDSLDADDLKKSDPESSYTTKQNVWRKWPGNEAGDYSGTRSGTAPIPDTALDLSSINIHIPMRRTIGPVLQTDDDGRRLPPVLEWYDGDAEEWQRVPPEWGYQLLDGEIGVLFSGDTPPEDLIAQGSNARLRITGTVQADKRFEYISEPRNSSPNLRDSTLWLDLSDRFHYRKRMLTGDLASQLSDSSGDDVDDSQDLIEYCNQARDLEDSAVMRADIVLHGVLTDYEIGDLITRCEGREISFNRNSKDAEDKRYLQVVGLQWNPQEQTTVLTVEPA